MPQPSVSIIIPTRNRPRDLTDAIRTIFTQTVLPAEIVIVDQSETDESRQVVNRLYNQASECVRTTTRIVHIWNKTLAGLTIARNCGIDKATGDIVLFLDDDVLLESEFLSELLGVYEQYPDVVGVSGVITNYTPPRLLYRLWASIFMRGPLHDDRQPIYWAASCRHSRDAVRVTRLGGGLMSFRAEAFRRVRFDENLRGVSDGEDVDFCIRLGPNATLFIAPAARLVHNQSPHGREQAHWLGRHARGTVYLYKRHWSRGFWNHACIAWLNIGYVLVAIIASSYRLSIQPWRALLAGKCEGLSAAGITRAKKAHVSPI